MSFRNLVSSVLFRAVVASTLLSSVPGCVEEPALSTDEQGLTAPPGCDAAAMAAYEAAKLAVQNALAQEAAVAASIAIEQQVLATSTSAVARALAEQRLAQLVPQHAAAQIARIEAQGALHQVMAGLGTCLNVVFAWVAVGGTSQAAEWNPPPPPTLEDCIALEELVGQFQEALAAAQALATANEAACAAGQRAPDVCAELRSRYADEHATITQQLEQAQAAFASCVNRLPLPEDDGGVGGDDGAGGGGAGGDDGGTGGDHGGGGGDMPAGGDDGSGAGGDGTGSGSGEPDGGAGYMPPGDDSGGAGDDGAGGGSGSGEPDGGAGYVPPGDDSGGAGDEGAGSGSGWPGMP